ncbi:ubiquitinyl hydrolase 1 [Trifolium repens]|nr:ubiquitinyl hydrolase 1 [Trifolium repens]
MAETETQTETQNQHVLTQRKIVFVPNCKPFKGFSNDFHIETLNPTTTSEQRQLVCVNGTSHPPPKKHDSSEFSEFGLDPELNFGITFRRIGAGLWNLGNTCFLNSVLQCLTYTAPLAGYLQSGKHKSSCRVKGFCALCAIQNHVTRVLKSTGAISPNDLVGNLRCISRNFQKSRQEDAHEYMVNLLESMHKCCLPSGVPSESPGAFEKSLVHKIFGGRLRSQVKCRQCNFSSNKFDPFLDLSLEILKANSLQKALENFIAAELLDGGEKQYHCQRCKQKVQALKQLTIHKAPYVLAIHLKRFYAYDPHKKIKKNVEFDSALDLKPFVSGSYDGDVKYSLYGVLVHSGYNTHSGHYYCYVRTSNNMWYTLDDTRVSHVSELEVLKQQAYMLFYVRDRKSVAPSKPVDIPKEENVKTNVIGSRYSSTSNTALKDYPNGHVENKFCVEPSLTAETQKNMLNADTSRVSCANNAQVQQKNSFILAKSLIHSEIPVSELTSKELTQKNSSVGLSFAKPELECLSSLDHSGKDKVPCNQKCLDAPAVDLPNLLNKNAVLEGVDSSLKEQTMSNPQSFIGQNVSDKTSQSQKKNSPTEVDAVAAQDSVTNLSDTASLVTSVGTSNGPVNVEACSLLCENVVVSQGLLEGSSNRSLSDLSLHQKQVKKSKKKFPKYHGSIMRLRPILHYVAYLGLRKKNHKKSKRREKLNKHAISTDAGLSTSGKAHLLPSVTSYSERELRKRMDQNCAVLAAATQVENMSQCLVENKFDAAHAFSSQDDKTDQMHNSVMRMLTRGLEETVVARWDDVELPSSELLESKNDQIAHIGYVGDEWDEAYDTGKRKKLRGLKQSFGGPNIFQQIATEKSTQLKRAKLDHFNSGNPPFRI